MQDQVAAGNLAVKRSNGVEAMIPIDLEAEEPKVKLSALAILKMRRMGMTELKADLHNCLLGGSYAKDIATFIGQAMRPLPRVIHSACSIPDVDPSPG
jgi:hypothetical protein